jgi:transposase
MSSEIISTVERRRSWSAEQKLRIMSEALEPGATVTAVAERNGVCRSQLYAWLRQARDARLPGIFLSPPTAAAAFVPVNIDPALASVPAEARQVTSPPSLASCAVPPACRASVVEISLRNGRGLKVDECIDPNVLARLLAVVDGPRS